jgi:7-cyano-7-deazaguanine synthase
MTKTEIVVMGYGLGVDFTDTWSCYKGKELHCGVCGTCTERREAFELAEIEDPTMYIKEIT